MAATVALVLVIGGAAAALTVARHALAPKHGPAGLGLTVSGTSHARNLAAGDRVERVYVLRNRAGTTLRRMSIEIVEPGVRSSRRHVARHARPGHHTQQRGLRATEYRPRAASRAHTRRRAHRAPRGRQHVSPLMSARRGGLRVMVQQCARPWVRTRRGNAFWCPRGRLRLVGWHRLPLRTPLGRMRPIPPGGRANVRVTIMLAASSSRSLSGLGVRITTRFTGMWWR